MYWTTHLEGGPRRVNHAAVVVNDKILSFGGYCTGENYKLRRPIDVYILNPVTLRWISLAEPKEKDPQYACAPFQRYGHTAVVYNNNVYIWGGRNDEYGCNTLFCFNTETLTWSIPQVSGEIPRGKDGHSACVIGDNMYIFGGFDVHQSRFCQDVYAFNFIKNQWSLVHTHGTPPLFRDFHTATAWGTRMYIFGGRGDEAGPFSSSHEIYCPVIMYLETKTNCWKTPTSRGSIPIGRRSHSAFSHNGYLYIFGGFNSVCNKHYNDLYRYNFAASEWQVVMTLGKRPCKRRRQVCLMIGDRLFVFGGTSPRDDADEDSLVEKLIDHDDMHILDFAPSLKKLCLMTVLENKLDQSCLPPTIRWDLKAMTTNNCLNRKLTSSG